MKYIVLFSAIIVLSTCGSSTNSLNTKETSMHANVDTHETQKAETTSFVQNLSSDAVILHFIIPKGDEKGNKNTIYHFETLKDFYNFREEYAKNLSKGPEYKANTLIIDSYGLMYQGKDISQTYSKKTLKDIFWILEQYPDTKKSLEINIEDEFLQDPEIKNLYDIFSK